MDKKVAILGTRGYPSYYGGFETLIRSLAPVLADNDWQVTVYGRRRMALSREGDSRVISVFTPGFEKKSLSTLSYGFTSALHAIWKKPDVALIMNVANGYWLPLLRLRGVPTVVNVDGMEWEREKWGSLAKLVFKFGARLTARFADHLVYDSVALGHRWSSEFGREGNYIPYGGDDPGLLPLPPEMGGNPYCLVVARFVPENTISEFLDSVESVSQKWNVAIVGSSGYGGAFDDRVKRLADSNPLVHWYGHVSDDQKLFSLWQHASAYFHGHSVGGTNPALVQAMACGAPVVARDTVYNREVLGDSAIFVDPTPGSIQEGIETLLSDQSLQDQFRSAGRGRVASAFSWKGVNQAYCELLDFAVNDRVRK